MGEGVIQRVIKNGFPTEIATLANAYTLTIMGVGSDDISQCNACRIILFSLSLTRLDWRRQAIVEAF